MLKMRMMFGLIAVVTVLALAQTGYSQLTITATSSPNPTADSAGFNEPAFNPNGGYNGITISGTVQTDTPFTGGRLRITFPGPITNACTVASSTSSSGCGALVNGPGQIVPGVTPGNNGGNAGIVDSHGNPLASNNGVQITFTNGVFLGASIVGINAVAGTVDITLPCTGSTSNFTALSVLWGNNGNGHISGASGTITLTGVRVDATTASGLPAGPANATLSLLETSSSVGIPGVTIPGPVTLCNGNIGGGSGVVLSTTTIPVISSAKPGIGSISASGMASSVSQPSTSNVTNGGIGVNNTSTTTANCTGSGTFFVNCGVATVFTNHGIAKGVGTFTVSEGFPSAWYHNDSTEFNGQDLSAGGNITTDDASFQLTFNNIPTGVTLSLAVGSWTATNGSEPTLSTGTGAGSSTPLSITSTNNTAVIHWNGDMDTTKTDSVTFLITKIAVGSSAAASLPAGSITVSAQMFPIQSSALSLQNGNGAALVWGNAPNSTFPSFMASPVTGPAVVNFVSASTTMLVPFAVVGSGFDTGLAIANTSVDPFNIGTTPSNGNVSVTFFPQTGSGTATGGTPVTGITVTTGPTKVAGNGMAQDGTVAPGSTWTVNVSQLWNGLAAQTGGFIGYMFITANFLPAHGAAYVATYSQNPPFTSATPVLVLPPPETNARLGIFPSAGAEILAF